MTTTEQERRERPRGRMRRFGNLLYAALRFIAGHVRGFWAAILTFLSMGFIFGVAAVVVFAQLADEVMEGATQKIDEWGLRWINTHRSETLDAVMIEITSLGNFAVLLVLLLCVSAFLWLSNHKVSVVLLLLGIGGGYLANNVLKLAFDRDRPAVFEHVTDVMSSSFPSGHAMVSTIAYASVAYLVGRLEPTPGMRRLTWLLAGVIIVLVAISRMYLGVHYPSDVIGGIIAGIAWLGFVVAGMHAIQYLAQRKPEGAKVEEQEKDLHAEEEREAGVRE
ncbi:MAG TPA: phosphatase PAP2 family protein [Longimicrobiales bacterium]|nr:phosphatase PAP2 family protein [Longimicrobiales bacterium]